MLRTTLSVSLALALFAASAFAQAFGPAQELTDAVLPLRCAHAADLDGDGDEDLLAGGAGRLDWFQNLGAGSFGEGRRISSGVGGIGGIDTADLDGDGDLDVLSASYIGNKIAWFENLGANQFGAQQVITNQLNNTQFVLAADLEGLLRPVQTSIRTHSVLNTLDLNGDGVLDREEFLRALIDADDF